MRILLISRLMTGFENSLKERVWKPSGSIAIARLIEILSQDQSIELNLIMTRTYSGSSVCEVRELGWHGKSLEISGLGTKVHVFAAQPWTWLPSRLAFLWVEACHLIRILYSIWRKNPDIIYLERSNWLIAGVLARITRAPVFLRMLGVPPDMWRICKPGHIFNRVMRWAFRAPFAYVLCTEDGSAGSSWMAKFIDSRTPRDTMLNGVDIEVCDSSTSESSAFHDKLNIVFVGRVEALKGADFFVKSLLSIPEQNKSAIRASIVGDGALLENLKDEVRVAGREDSILFTGAVSGDNVKQALASADLYVSLNRQGHLSNANLEAISIGVPVLVQELRRDIEPLGGINLILPSELLYVLPADATPEDLGILLVSLFNRKSRLASLRSEVRRARDAKLCSWNVRISKEIKLLRDISSKSKTND